MESDASKRWRLAAIFSALQGMADEHATALGMGYDMVFGKGLAWVLTRINVEVTRYPSVYEEVTVGTWYAPPGRLTFDRHFEVLGAGGEPLVAAYSVWAMMDLSTRSVVKVRDLGIMFPDGSSEPPVAAAPGKLAYSGLMEVAEHRRARYGDIDTNGHMNNARYVEWLCDMGETQKDGRCAVRRMAVRFMSETLPGDILELSVGRGEGALHVRGQNLTKNETAFESEIALG